MMVENVEMHDSVTVKAVWSALTDTGKERTENQDSYFVNEELSLFIVSDGMGGHRGGRLASTIVVEDLPVMIETELHKLRSHRPRSICNVLRRSIIEQNRHMYMEGHSETGYVDMGATVVAVYLQNGRAHVANVGDSQAFRFRNTNLWQITKDHTVIAELIENNQIDASEADDHPAQGQITQYIGMRKEVDPHVRTFELKKNDGILLCSDGLTDMVELKQIEAVLTCEKDPEAICKTLVDAANTGGGHDNTTVIYIRY
jgi:protein phosphatase